MQQVVVLWFLCLCALASGAYPVTLTLAQYGMMQGLSTGISNVYQAAQRAAVPSVVCVAIFFTRTYLLKYIDVFFLSIFN
jgi:hypothetical protein